MSKRVTITPDIEAKIRHAIGDASFNTSGIAVYETRALSTEKITQNGLFNGARTTAASLMEMADVLKAEGSAVPLIIMHRGGTLPIGRVFFAESFIMPNGETELRVLFYVPSDKGEFAKDIDNGLITEVSVGVKFKQAFCSECGFDYFGEEATFDNFWDLECNEGHRIGFEGVHLRLVGLDHWGELSLVDRGAAKDAKIMAEGKRKLAASRTERLGQLAASTSSVARHQWLDATSSFTGEDPQPTQPKAKESNMSNEVMTLSAALGDEKVKVALAQKEASDAQTALAASQADLKTAQEQIAALKQANEDGAKVVAEKDAAQAALKAADEALSEHVKAALVAAGTPDAEIPAGVDAKLALIKETGTKLHQLVLAGSGGRSKETKGDVEGGNAANPSRAAFKLS